MFGKKIEELMEVIRRKFAPTRSELMEELAAVRARLLDEDLKYVPSLRRTLRQEEARIEGKLTRMDAKTKATR